MTLESFAQYTQTIPAQVQFNFTGYVEPFLNPNSLDIVELAYRKGHSLMVNTTLEGLKTSDISRLRKLEFIRGFNIHLPSGTFEEMIGVKKPKSLYSPNSNDVALALSDSYIDLLDHLVEHPLPHQTYHCHGSLHPQLVEHLRHVEVSVRGINTRAANLLLEKTSPVPPERNIRGKCVRVEQNVLLPNGKISLCCQDYGLDEILGDLSVQTWKQYRESEKFKSALSMGCDMCDYCEMGETHSDLYSMSS